MDCVTATGNMLVMTPPTSSSRFLLLPETRSQEDSEDRPKIRRYRLTRVGACGSAHRPESFEYLRRMHD